MSVSSERSALDRPVSLFEHAQRLHRRTPDDPLPAGGRPFPDDGDQPRIPYPERKPALTAALREFLATPSSAQDLHDVCTRLTISSRDVAWVSETVPQPSPRLLDIARWLVRHGTDRRAVIVGLGLLGGHAEQHDIPMLTVIGRLSFADYLAIGALTRIPGAERDLIWLAERSRSHPRIRAVESLLGHRDPAVRDWVRCTPRELLSSDLARKIAQAHALAELLNGPAVDDALWDQAGNLLLAMTSTRNYRSEIGRYPDAPAVYQRWVTLAGQRPPTLGRATLLATVAEDLRTGPAAPVVGESRGRLVDRIGSLLSAGPWLARLRRDARSADPVEARRAAWVIAQTAKGGVPAGRFVVQVVVPAPETVGFPVVEARILIDGMPVVATAFDRGGAESPEQLLHSGRLRATDDPREVRLAEAYCTEGCCGGLYVTITRDGPEVVWQDWRSSTPGDPPQETRFDAADYDREIARAERDHSWEWPARTVARLVAERLDTDPTILGRWDCRPGWCTAWLRDLDRVRLTFEHPARRTPSDEPSVQFGLVVDVHDQDPAALAAAVIESILDIDPKTTAEIVGGSQDGAEKLGLTYRKPTRW
ncbi:hypothetical protein [Actinophytocola sediminis]